MRHLARHLALAACIVTTGSLASAGPTSHRGKVTKKAGKSEERTSRDGARIAHEKWATSHEDEGVADDEAPASAKLTRSSHAKKAKLHARGTAAEDLFADEGDTDAHTSDARRAHALGLGRHADLDEPASDDDGGAPRKHAGAHHAELDTFARPAKKAGKHHAIVETLVDDNDRHVDVDTASDDDDDRSGAASHHTATSRAADDDAPASTSHKKAHRHHSNVETLPDDADSAPRKKTGKHHAETSARADDSAPPEADDASVARSEPGLTGTVHHPHARADGDTRSERVAFADPDQAAHAVDADTIQIDGPVKVHKLLEPQSKDWHVAIGPYLWASSVDANVSLGPTTVSSGVDFVQLEQHARYGMELLSEARYKRFGLYGDLLYGVVAVDGSRTVGPLMVSLAGEASSVLVDGAAGYTFYGDDHSVLSLEARGGVRYQRTGVSASLGLSGATVAPPEQVSAGADALAGGHVVVRPLDWFFLTSTVDIGVVGASSRTWSASADANVQLGSRLLLSVGYRTLTMDRSAIELVMHGPRAAVQLTF